MLPVLIWHKVQNELWCTKKNRSEHEGQERKKNKDQETDTANTVKERQAKEDERLVEKKTPNVILHSLHGVQGRRERE